MSFACHPAGPGETWGLAVNEALACGCHVIVSDRVGCAEDLVKGQPFGRIIPAQKSNLWTNAMREASRSHSNDAEMVKYIQNWDPQRLCTALKNKLQ